MQVSESAQRSYLLAGLDDDVHYHLVHLLDRPEVSADDDGSDADLALEEAMTVQRLERAERLRRQARRNVDAAEALADCRSLHRSCTWTRNCIWLRSN